MHSWKLNSLKANKKANSEMEFACKLLDAINLFGVGKATVDANHFAVDVICFRRQ